MACGSLRKRDGHSSGAPVARRIVQPTRLTDLDRPDARRRQRHPYSVLLPVRFAVPPPLLTRAVGSYPTVSPLPSANTQRGRRRSVFCGTVSETRAVKPTSRRTLSGTVCPWSPDFPLRTPFGIG